jgi:hypothetical protein
LLLALKFDNLLSCTWKACFIPFWTIFSIVLATFRVHGYFYSLTFRSYVHTLNRSTDNFARAVRFKQLSAMFPLLALSGSACLCSLLWDGNIMTTWAPIVPFLCVFQLTFFACMMLILVGYSGYSFRSSIVGHLFWPVPFIIQAVLWTLRYLRFPSLLL